MQTNKMGSAFTTEASPLRQFRQAFAKARSEFKPVTKNQDNPFFHSKYASLTDFTEATSEALSNNGFTLHQLLETDGMTNTLVTKLCHEAGHEEVSRMLIKSKDDTDPQKVGSCLTYFRRYCLSALLGISADDDDGNTAAEKKSNYTITPRPTTTTPKTGKVISEKQAGRFYAIAKTKQWNGVQVNALLKTYGYTGAEQIVWTDYETICKDLEAGPKTSGHKDFDEPPPYDDTDLTNIPF